MVKGSSKQNQVWCLSAERMVSLPLYILATTSPLDPCLSQWYFCFTDNVLVLSDATSGQPVLNIQQKPLSLHREFRIFNGESSEEQLVTIRGKFKLMGAPEMTVHFKNKFDGKEIELGVLGDFWRRKASISCGGQTVARVDRSFLNSGQLQFDQQTYYLTVAPQGAFL